MVDGKKEATEVRIKSFSVSFVCEFCMFVYEPKELLILVVRFILPSEVLGAQFSKRNIKIKICR